MWWFWCQKLNLFAHWYKWNFRVLGEIEKNSRAVLLCQVKEDTVGSCALRTVYPNPGGFDEEFYNNDSKVGTGWRCEQSLHCLNLNSGSVQFSSIQFSSVTQLCPTLCDPMNCCIPGLPVHHQLPESTQTHVHWVDDAIQPSHPLSSPSHPALNLSLHQGLFKWISSSHQVAKVLEFQLHISPSNEYSGLISFRIDWLGLLAVQGTLKSLLQHHSSKALILQRSAFFIVQLSHPYMTTGKNHSLD